MSDLDGKRSAEADVSRETLDLHRRYEDAVRRWSPRINLVARGDLQDLRSRHVMDSLALARFLPATGVWVDIGSGGGLPAVPLAIAGRDRPNLTFVAVESDQRKGAFLREISRTLDLRLTTRTERAEQISDLKATVVSARAFAPVDRLLDIVDGSSLRNAPLVLLKGERLFEELTYACVRWHIRYQALRHPTVRNSYILIIQEFRRAQRS